MKIRTWCLETIPIRTYSTSSHSNLVNRIYCPKPNKIDLFVKSDRKGYQRKTDNRDVRAIVLNNGDVSAKSPLKQKQSS